MCTLTLPHTRWNTHPWQNHAPVTELTPLLCRPPVTTMMNCHDFMVNSQFLPLSVFSGIRKGGCTLYKRGVPSLTPHSLHISHGCSLCGPRRSVIGPSPHSSPWEWQREELETQATECVAVCPSVSMCVCQKGNVHITTRALARMNKKKENRHK